jgi:hypothetical protein
MTDSETLQALFDEGGEVRLDAGLYLLDQPLTVRPDRSLTVRGCGMGVTRLMLTNGGESVIVADRDRPIGALSLSDFSVHPGGRSRPGVAVHVRAPKLFAANRGHSAEVVIERLEVEGSGFASFALGICCENITGPKVDKCWVSGRFSDVTSEALADDGAMEIAFDMAGSQEAKITNSYAACTRTGVRSTVPMAGCGEGIEISGNAFVCVDEGFALIGERPGVHGAWATPWSVISKNHIFYNQKAGFLVNRSDVVIADNSFCGSHLVSAASVPVSLHLAACQNARIHHNSFWNPSLSGRVRGYGMVIDGCTGGTLVGNICDPSLDVAVWMAEVSGPNRRWHAAANDWAAARGVIDHRGNPMGIAA